MTETRKARFQKLDDWLVEVNGKAIRTEDLKNGDRLVWIVVKGRVMILQEYADNNGWSVFVDPSDSNRIEDTIKDLAVWASRGEVR